MFFHATLARDNTTKNTSAAWQDHSTATHFKFDSPSGSLRLLRRADYPATYAYVDGPVLKAGYGNEELARQDPSDMDGPLYSEEFLHLELDCTQGSVTIKRDYFCTLPLFTAHSNTSLSLSNLFEDACSALPSEELLLDRQKLHSFFTDTHVGRADTYIKNCLPLGAFDEISWKDGHLQRTFHSFPDFIPEDTTLKERYGDPVSFRRFFDGLMEEYAKKYAAHPIACEFSGGIDSAMVAGYLADGGHDPLLVTVGFPGSFHETQAAKIEHFKERFHTRHRTVDLDSPQTSPLARMTLNDAWHPFYQDEEIYYDAFQMHARYLAKNAIGVSFNGLGGDDVVARFDFPERQKPLPRFFEDSFAEVRQTQRGSNDSFARVANQFVMQKISCNNVYLEHGIWPVAPFTDPRLFLYCQSLKPRYRDNKNIYRIYCQAWGYPESIYQPSVNENFGPFFKRFADRQLQPLAERWLKESALAELGLINKERALDYALHPANDEEQFQAYRLITTEINLQTLGILQIS